MSAATRTTRRDQLTALRSPDPAERARALKSLGRRPSTDADVRRLMEALLDDQTCTAVTIPILFGEVRLLAAHAFARLFRQLGDTRIVRLRRAPELYRGASLSEIAASAGGYKLMGAGKLMATLRDDGHLPLRDLFFDPAKVHDYFALPRPPREPRDGALLRAAANHVGPFIEVDGIAGDG